MILFFLRREEENTKKPMWAEPTASDFNLLAVGSSQSKVNFSFVAVGSSQIRA